MTPTAAKKGMSYHTGRQPVRLNLLPGMPLDPETYRHLLAVDTAHTLELADSRVKDKSGVEQESHLLRELDADHNIVAHYRVWTHQSLKPPYRRQRGWEKYSPGMTLLDREIRFSTPENGNTLH
ncbi:MAG: hypothetical protein KTR32_27785 [Granulosicoccus sp.]|nr:hypothetical protein [Granulosicoccus sp.]